MNSNYFHDSHNSAQPKSGGKISIDRRPHLRITPYHQSSTFKKGNRQRIPMSVNRLKNSVPYKSELCLLFQKGKCYHGENCHFAHELSEIRQQNSKPVGMEELVRERNGVMRGRECYFFARGLDCPYGDKCFYLHKCGENLGGSYSGLNSYGSAGDSIERRSSREGRNHDKSVFYFKTKLCEKWERDGSCPYELNCTYAHGREELRQVGYYAKLEKGRDSRLMLGSRSSFAGSCMEGIKAAIKKGKVPIMVWNISKMSRTYADWVGVGHDLPNLF